MNSINIDEITLEKLKEIVWLDERAYNICKFNSLNTLNLIISYYQTYNSFKSLRNCGEKTNNDLVEICEKYMRLPSFKNENYIDKVNSYSIFQKSILYKHLEYLISNLSVRSYNGLARICTSLNPIDVFEFIFSKKIDFNEIQNIGVKSALDLENLKLEIIKFINLLNIIEKDKLNKEYTKLIIKTTFDDIPKNLETKIDSFYTDNGKLKLFNLLNWLLDGSDIFSLTQKNIFSNIYKKNSEDKKIELIAEEGNVTIERVRQIKIKLLDEIKNYFLFVYNFSFNDIINYDINSSSSLITFNNSFSDKINENEMVNFKSNFYGIIFGNLLEKTHTLIECNRVIYGNYIPKNKKRHENCYLINNTLRMNFDFENFILNIFLQKNKRIYETYSLKFQEYIFKFIKNEGKTFIKEIYSVCETIVFNEFQFVVSSDGYLRFEKNTLKKLHEYFYEILNEASTPMSAEEIKAVLNKKYPSVKTTIGSIRGILIREKHLFICLGKTKIYALRGWEVENENLKTGSIRDLVEEYLISKDSPIHISEILDYVLIYRPDTNHRSILNNLKVDNTKNFIFLSGDFIGLKSKKYNTKIKYKGLRGNFTKKQLIKMNGWNIDDIINYYITKYGYQKIQIEYHLKMKAQKGEFNLSDENKLIM